jgi:signal transduction histidine kinase
MRALDVIRPAADAKDLLVHADAPEGGVRIAGDADRLQQVVWNLLGNSVKFTPAGGRIDVRLMQTDGSAQIVVTDTGKGMSREFLPHAFERFRQGAHSGADPAAGLGIGLALVRELVEAHGGSVDASSAGDGHGSTFTVTLPLRGLPQQSLPAPMPSLEAIDIPSFTK